MFNKWEFYEKMSSASLGIRSTKYVILEILSMILWAAFFIFFHAAFPSS